MGGCADALTKFHDEAIAAWRYRPIKGWVHGDAHLGNILRNEQDQIRLIDFAEVRAGHWVEDAIALERPLWQRPELLANVDPVDMMAGYRRQWGCRWQLKTDAWPRSGEPCWPRPPRRGPRPKGVFRLAVNPEGTGARTPRDPLILISDSNCLPLECSVRSKP